METIHNWFSEKTWQWWTRRGIAIGSCASATALVFELAPKQDLPTRCIYLGALMVCYTCALILVIDETNSGKQIVWDNKDNVSKS